MSTSVRAKIVIGIRFNHVDFWDTKETILCCPRCHSKDTTKPNAKFCDQCASELKTKDVLVATPQWKQYCDKQQKLPEDMWNELWQAESGAGIHPIYAMQTGYTTRDNRLGPVAIGFALAKTQNWADADHRTAELTLEDARHCALEATGMARWIFGKQELPHVSIYTVVEVN